jgi:hypothetical protein
LIDKKLLLIAAIEGGILLFLPFSFEAFVNMQTGSISAFFVVLASGLAQKKGIAKKVKNNIVAKERDIIDEIEDRYDLYGDDQLEPNSEVDIKEFIKEEKKRHKVINKESLKEGFKIGFSPWRLGAYLILVFGFIALENNNMLNIGFYMTSLALGIVAATIYLQRGVYG